MDKIEREKFIVESLQNNISINKIASSLGISGERVRQIGKRLGVDISLQRRQIKEKKIEKILEEKNTIGLDTTLSKASAVLLNESGSKKYKDIVLENRVKKVVELYNSGVRPIDIKRTLNCSLITVYKYLHSVGIKMKLTQEEKIERDGRIKGDYTSGNYTYKSLATKYNLSTQMIAYIITNYKATPSDKKSNHNDRMRKYQCKEGSREYKKTV